MIRLIAAIDRKRGIAKHGFMPWNIPDDEDYFTRMTKAFGGNVLSGGTTFREAYQNKPLEGRQNFILTHDSTPIESAQVVNSLDEFLEKFGQNLWIAGGAKVFDQVIKKADELYLTHIDADFGCDQFFPVYENDFEPIEETARQEQNGFFFNYAIYRRKIT